MDPQDHHGVVPFAKNGHMIVLNTMSKVKIIRNRQKFGRTLAKIAISNTPRLIANIYRGWLKHKQIAKRINTLIILVRGSR